MSGNEWNISVQAYEFSITPVNMFPNGSTTSKYIVQFIEIHGMFKEVFLQYY